MSEFKIPADTTIGHVHLKVSNLDKALAFYVDLLGFDIMQKYGDQAAFISAGGYHHHIGLNTWESKGSPPAPKQYPGLFHTAIKVPSRKDLALMLKRLNDHNYPFTGYADHGVSEALYLDDPDGNGVEIYWDRPKEDWPMHKDGSLDMYTRRLNLSDLMRELED